MEKKSFNRRVDREKDTYGYVQIVKSVKSNGPETYPNHRRLLRSIRRSPPSVLQSLREMQRQRPQQISKRRRPRHNSLRFSFFDQKNLWKKNDNRKRSVYFINYDELSGCCCASGWRKKNMDKSIWERNDMPRSGLTLWNGRGERGKVARIGVTFWRSDSVSPSEEEENTEYSSFRETGFPYPAVFSAHAREKNVPTVNSLAKIVFSTFRERKKVVAQKRSAEEETEILRNGKIFHEAHEKKKSHQIWP